MRPPREPLFLARETYRRRRLMDAARALPVLGAFLFLVPMLWARGSETSDGTLYIFAVWFGLIVLSAAISRRLGPGTDGERAETEDEDT